MRRLTRLLLAALVTTTASCTFGERDVPAGVDKPVLHGVLNPFVYEQSILIERTLTGRVTVGNDSMSTAADPIFTGGGVPITGARVTVSDSLGHTATAIERTVIRSGASAEGTGVYLFLNTAATESASKPAGYGLANQLAIVPGRRYRLRAELPDGRVTTGSTIVPGTTLPPNDFSALTFLRDVDTLKLEWPAVPGARTYALRVESPYGAFLLFVDSTRVSLTGELRNLFADRLPRVFQAGFTQNLYVAAVDTNYFDYYRSTNSAFSGSGIINRLTGGIGVFGAYTPILSRALFVRATNREPEDGRYAAAAPGGQELLRLWVDSRGNGVTALSGAYRLVGETQYGVLGTLTGDHIHLSAIDNRDSRIVVRTIDGVLKGDTITVQVTGQIATNDPGRRVFVKQRADSL